MSETGETREGDGPGGRSRVERADELIGAWSRRLGDWLARTASRAREEVEDIWDEAQSVRRRQRA